MRSSNKTGFGILLGAACLGLGVVAVVANAKRNEEELERRARLLARVGDALRSAAAILRVPVPALVDDPNTANAASDGRSIRVNLEWVALQADRFCNNTACVEGWLVGLMGHELGHHIYGDAFYRLFSRAEVHDMELRADACAGFVLGQLGIDADHFAIIISAASPFGSATHPPGDWREVVIHRYYRLGLRRRSAARNAALDAAWG